MEMQPLKRELLGEFESAVASQPNFPNLSEKTLELVQSKYPALTEKIVAFQSRHNDKCSALKGGLSWSVIKKNYADGLISDQEMEQWEKFRQEAKNLIEEMVNQIVRDTGRPEPKWVAIGTPGYASDIDNVIYSEPKDEYGIALGKALFDTLWLAIFKGTSGRQIDLETYTSQIGNRETLTKLESEDQKAQYAAIGFMGAHIQNYRCLNAEQKEKYQKKFLDLVEKQLGAPKREVYAKLFKDVEDFENHIQSEICKKGNLDEKKVDVNSETYKLAKFAYKTPKILQISKRIQECENKIDALRKRGNNTKEIEKLEVEIAEYGLMREAFMDEGYVSQGAYLDICKRGGGQAEARQWEAVSHQLHHGTGMGITSAPAQSSVSSPQDLVESIQENAALAVLKYEAYEDHTQGIIETSKYSDRITTAAGALLKQVTSQEDKVVLEGVIAKCSVLTEDLLLLKRQKQIPLDAFERYLRIGLNTVVRGNETVLKEMGAPSTSLFKRLRQTTLERFKGQLKEVLNKTQQGRNENEIDAFVENLFSEVPPGSDWNDWNELNKYLRLTFRVFNVENAVKEASTILRPLKAVEEDYKGTDVNQRRELLVSRLAAKGFIPISVKVSAGGSGRVEALFSKLNPVLAAGVGADSGSPEMKKLQKSASAEFLSNRNLNSREETEKHIEELLEISIQTTILAQKEGLCPTAANLETSLCESYKSL